jgi:hypothetical protein
MKRHMGQDFHALDLRRLLEVLDQFLVGEREGARVSAE